MVSIFGSEFAFMDVGVPVITMRALRCDGPSTSMHTLLMVWRAAKITTASAALSCVPSQENVHSLHLCIIRKALL